MNDRCKWIYKKGPSKGKVCNKNVSKGNQLCAKHMRNDTPQEDNDDIKSETPSICTTIEPEKNENKILPKISESKEKFKEEIDSSNNNDDENILLSKYFVYDCIKEFFRDHKEMNDILNDSSKPSSSSSNLPMILAMAGIGTLPLILKNFMNTNINAIHKQDPINAPCDRGGIFEGSTTTEQQGTFTIHSENIQEKNRNNNETENNATDHTVRYHKC